MTNYSLYSCVLGALVVSICNWEIVVRLETGIASAI